MHTDNLPNEASIQELIEWGNEHGAYLHSHVEIYEDPVTGVSFRAAQELPPESNIVNCPYSISLSYLNAINTPGFTSHSEPFSQNFLDAFSEEDPNIIGHFFLVQQYLLKENSFWWPYIRLLPQPNQPDKLGIPIWWPEEDQKFLNGTNAEPPIKIRTALWMDEWERALSVLEDGGLKWEEYSYELYQWAATIFGTRSFRASLTIPQGLVQDGLPKTYRISEHVKEDRFSFLLPILDIGNHNGINNVDWNADTNTGLSLSNRSAIPLDEQVFNFYGTKSNSELIVGYGFILPKTDVFDNEVVNIKVKPSPEALVLHRAQACNAFQGVPAEEFMFAVGFQQHMPAGEGCFSAFSHGLIDLIICMVANKRESRFLSLNTEFCPALDPDLFQGALRRASVRALEILYVKLEYEIARIQDSTAYLGAPSNHNQKIAMNYRNSQLDVLQHALTPISNRILFALSSSSICPSAGPHQKENLGSKVSQALSLEYAFEWLHLNHSSICDAVLQMISEDQEEPLPLDWAVLVDDWDHAYWVVWIFLVSMIQLRDENKFMARHGSISSWLVEMRESYEAEISDSPQAADILYAERDEEETINEMIEGISHLPEFSTSSSIQRLANPESTTKLRNFASFVAEEEGFSVKYKMKTGQVIEQKVICVGVGRPASLRS